MYAKHTLVYFSVLCLIIATLCIGLVKASLGFTWTISSDKPTYNLQEKARIYGSINYYGSPVVDALMGIQVVDPLGSTLLYRTLVTSDVSIPAGEVEITAVFPCDGDGQPKSSPVFSPGALANFKVTIRNNSPESKFGY